MNHSTPINSPSAVNASRPLFSPPCSPIRWNNVHRVVLGTSTASHEQKHHHSSQYVHYLDEWVMNLSSITEYLDLVDSVSHFQEASSDLDLSSFDDWVSFDDNELSTSRIHAVDVTFLRSWLENHSLCEFDDECREPMEVSAPQDSQMFVTVIEGEDFFGQESLYRLTDSEVWLREILQSAPTARGKANQSQIQSEERAHKKEPSWMKYEKSLRSTSWKRSKFSYLKKLFKKK